MRILAYIGMLISAAIRDVAKLIVRTGNMMLGLPQPDFDPPVEGPSAADIAREQYLAEIKAVIEACAARFEDRDPPEMPPRLAGWFSQLEDGDCLRLIDANDSGELGGHLTGTRPIFGVPPVSTATDTAAYLQRRDMLRAHERAEARARREAPAAGIDWAPANAYAGAPLDDIDRRRDGISLRLH